ncbi:MAG TPA: carboxypeptidase regulatory-like domain-containing protein [Terriglobales bacterium]|nr:carboxypeptidase regulatory-like domain-containing protein [Terriglobales bacterium]
MQFGSVVAKVGLILLLLAVLFIFGVGRARAQTGPGTLHGHVTDPSGAAVVNATVEVLKPDGQATTTATNRVGVFDVKGLAPGQYVIKVDAPGFATFLEQDVEITAGPPRELNVTLSIAVEKQEVEVQEHTTTVDVAPSRNASAVVMTGKDLEALSDDPDELQSDLEALAGPSAGPNGGQLYIDGFTAGQLPPKSSIREIRINQNPFSSEYDKLGYGRIEIFTKPGTDKFHGQIAVQGNSSAFNSKNPFLAQEPSYYSTQYMGSVGGPINKRSSFFFDFQRRNINEVAIINAEILNPACQPGQPTSCNSANYAYNYTAAVPNPYARTNLSPRIDYQLSKNNTLTARYQFFQDTQTNDGVGGFSLASQGYNSRSTEHTLQLGDTQVVGTKIINETRFQYLHDYEDQAAQNTDTSVEVADAFSSGGSAVGNTSSLSNHYELQNYTSISLGKHYLKFGGRLRSVHEDSIQAVNFNGTYYFPSIQAYRDSFVGLGQLASQYQQTSGGISSSGSPSPPVPGASVSWVDAGLYLQDDWRVRANLTLSYGLRFETQSKIDDHADWAPRVGLSWGVGGGGKNAAKTVVRAGFGMFYDRFKEDYMLQALRFNGANQVNYIVPSPDFFSYPPQPPSLLPSLVSPTSYLIDPALHAPCIIQSAVSVEQQISKDANFTVSYLNSRGVHQFLTRNINAPIPPAIDPTDPRVRPYGNLDNMYQYASEGIFKQNQLIANANVRVGARLSLFGYYTLNYANSDVGRISDFPSNQYDLSVDYGRASYDFRHRAFVGGTIALPYAFRLSPFMIVTSGMPYNVTVGQDLNGDSIFNDRPAFAANAAGSCELPTEACHYNANPDPTAARVPINYLTGPSRFTLNLRLGKTFGFGPEGGGTTAGQAGTAGGPHGGHGPQGGGYGRSMSGPFGLGPVTNRRYNLTFSVLARNALNRMNLATPIGNVNSPFFGESTALAGGPFSSTAANRRIELQATFSF